ncbi:MAG TPA: hypothetical protein VF762_01730 [Blastocatellia bacterium]
MSTIASTSARRVLLALSFHRVLPAAHFGMLDAKAAQSMLQSRRRANGAA